jgi:hypothetical protein
MYLIRRYADVVCRGEKIVVTMKVRYIGTLLILMLMSANIYADNAVSVLDGVVKGQAKQEKSVVTNTKKQATKRGWGFTPSPSLGYDSDTGFQIGVMCDVYDYGDGSLYPGYRHKAFVNLSWTTRNQIKLHFFYDSKYLIPKVRFTAVVTYILSQMYPFMGFNGAATPYYDHLASGRKQKNRVAMYNIQRDMLRAMFDFQGDIYTNKFRWAAGISYWWYDDRDISLKKKGKYVYDSFSANSYLRDEQNVNYPSLWRLYKESGLILPSEANGGHHIELKAGVVFDSREHEADPTRGIWAELYAYGSPDILNGRKGKDAYHYLKLAAHFRHYVSIWQDKIVFAYHLAYQGKLVGNAPYYTLQNINAIFLNQMISDGLGSVSTVRGVPYNSVIGDGLAWANFEMRFKVASFRLFNQDFYLATNPFFDMGACVQEYRLDKMKQLRRQHDDNKQRGLPTTYSDAEMNLIYTGKSPKLHLSAGIGFKIVMNRNFVLSAEFGIPLNTEVYSNTQLNVPVDKLTTKKSYSPGVNIGMNYIF